MKTSMTDPSTHVTTLANGVRVLVLPMPYLGSVGVSVFVRTGSRHEAAGENGISHFVEHMAFKGTRRRDCQRINLDAERLGAEVNAHTDKDHTAFHMRGLATHAGRFVRMLADIVQDSTFPAPELERERQVLLQEFAENQDDPLATAFKLFDRACYGRHPVAQPVIGTRAHIERFTRAQLLAYVRSRYTARNVVVGVAGAVDPDAIVREVEAAFGHMPDGPAPLDTEPRYRGGFQLRRRSGHSQTDVVLGYPIPGLREPGCEAACLAAAVFGEGMSSPLLDELREKRGIVYYAACSADVNDLGGQMVVEASMQPARVEEFLTEAWRLLEAQADALDAVGLQRARHQLLARALRAHEQPMQRLEASALDLFVFGRVRSLAEREAALRRVQRAQVRRAFQQMLAHPPAVAVVGRLPQPVQRRLDARIAAAFESAHPAAP